MCVCVSGELTRDHATSRKSVIPDLNTFSTVWSWSGLVFEFATAYPSKTFFEIFVNIFVDIVLKFFLNIFCNIIYIFCIFKNII